MTLSSAGVIAAITFCCSAPVPGAAATWRWSGLDPTSSAWTRPGNWDLLSPPVNDGSAALVFGDNAPSARHDPVADAPWSLATLDLDPYTLSGARLSLHTGITMGGSPPAGLVHRISNDIQLLGDNVWSNQGSGSTLSASGDLDLGSHRLTLVQGGFTTSILLHGDISGTGGLVKGGDGAVRLSGNNSYTGGTTVLSGLLVAESPNAIPPGTVAMRNGILNLGTTGNVLGPGASELDGLVLGGVVSASPSVSGFPIRVSSLGDWIVYDATGDPGESLLSGALDLASASGSRVIRIEDTARTTEELTVLAQIINPASIPGPEPAVKKRGPGRLLLGGMNTYGRAMQIEEGPVLLHRPEAVGASGPGDPTIVLAGGALELGSPFTVPTESLRLNGSGVLGTGAMRSLGGSHGWGGPVALESDATIEASPEGERFTITGSVSGSGGLVKIGDGALVLTTTNSYQGDTMVRQGTLRADNVVGHAVPGALTVDSGATLAGDGSSGTGTRHDVMRGNLAAVSFLGTGPEDVCLADGLDGTELQDPSADPPSGSGYFYLVRGANVCGDGRYETASDGQDRATSACRLSLGSQGLHRIDSRRTPCGQPAGHQRHDPDREENVHGVNSPSAG